MLRRAAAPYYGDATMPAKKEHRLDEIFEARTDLTVPTSVRFSAGLLKRIDAIAAARGITRTEAIEKLLAWSLDELDPKAGQAEDLKARRRRAGRK